MKKQTKIITITAILLLIIIAITSFFIFESRKTKTIVFFDLNEKEVESIKAEIHKITSAENFEYISIQEDFKKVKSAKPSLIFVKSGVNLQKAINMANKKASINVNESNISEITSSIRSSIPMIEGKISAIPLLTSHMEIDIDLVAYRNSGMSKIDSWEDIEAFARIQKRYNDFPIIFAGKDAKFTLDMFGAMTEAFSGVEEYYNAVKIINDNSEKKFNSTKVARLLAESNDSPFNKSFRYLKNLIDEGLIDKNVFSLTKKDVKAYIKARLSNVVFMTLDEHRNLDNNVIGRFSSIYFPSLNTANNRRFTAPETFAVPLTNKYGIKNIVSELSKTAYQEELSRATGFAPVLNHCKTPDKQADDVRYWIAATNAPLAGLSNEINITKEQQQQLLAELVLYLK